MYNWNTCLFILFSQLLILYVCFDLHMRLDSTMSISYALSCDHAPLNFLPPAVGRASLWVPSAIALCPLTLDHLVCDQCVVSSTKYIFRIQHSLHAKLSGPARLECALRIRAIFLHRAAMARNMGRSATSATDRQDLFLVSSSPVLPANRPSTALAPKITPLTRRSDAVFAGPDSAHNFMESTSASAPQYITIGSTPDSISRIVETSSKFFANSQDPPMPTEIPSRAMDKTDEGDWERTIQRRRDWTPPADTVTAPATGSSPTPEEWSSQTGDASSKREIFQNLHDNFNYKPNDMPSMAPPATCVKENAFAKRNEIEAISIGDAQQIDKNTPKTKTKAPKKKPRTLTELAVAAYADTSLASRESVAAKRVTTTKRQLETVDEVSFIEDIDVRPGHPTSKLRKLKTTSKMPATKKGKPKKTSRPPRRVVLSPGSARTEAMHQDFLFGTSSQLTGERSPTFLHDLHKAMQASNQEYANDVLDVLDDIGTVDLTSSLAGNMKMWGASWRSRDGNVTFDNVVDLEDTIEFPEDPHQIIAMAQRAAEEAQLKASEDSSLPKETRDATKGTRTNKAGATRNFKASSRTARSQAPRLVSPKRLVSPPVGEPSLPATQEEHSDNPRPRFEVLTNAELSKRVASYGYKTIRGRAAMITLLNECWEAQQQPLLPSTGALHALQPANSILAIPKSQPQSRTKITKLTQPTGSILSPPRPALLNATAPPHANARYSTGGAQAAERRETMINTQREPDDRLVFEIEDSESDGRFSPPEAACSIASDGASDMPAEEEDDNILFSSVPTSEELKLFPYIAQAVIQAPRTDDPLHPSWHEKMLMYDTIILETFTSWLNDGQLLAAGYSDTVTAVQVKRWCESKSVCCTWQKNLHGRERKLC